jgi:hypothetical protein
MNSQGRCRLCLPGSGHMRGEQHPPRYQRPGWLPDSIVTGGQPAEQFTCFKERGSTSEISDGVLAPASPKCSFQCRILEPLVGRQAQHWLQCTQANRNRNPHRWPVLLNPQVAQPASRDQAAHRPARCTRAMCPVFSSGPAAGRAPTQSVPVAGPSPRKTDPVPEKAWDDRGEDGGPAADSLWSGPL